MLASRLPSIGLILGTLAACCGCLAVPKARFDAVQAQNAALVERNQDQTAQIENLKIHSRNIEDQLMRTEEELALLEEQLGMDRKQLANYRAERDQLHQHFLGMIHAGSPVSPEVRGRLAQISRRHPQLRFDPQTGVTKLDTDILFDDGMAELKPGAEDVLRQLARVLKSPDARDLKILVVGHTDDRLVAAKPVREKYPNNFHLSAHRALCVSDKLRELGLDAERMGIGGFGPNQPIAPNSTGEDRQKNRRVELFVMAPEVPVIGRTETTPSLYSQARAK
jgi:chemotaxis protein MotB